MCKIGGNTNSRKEIVPMEDYIIIYTPYITVKGKKLYAKYYGLKAFRISIPKNRYKIK